MSSASNSRHQLQLPASLESQLHDFRRRVWAIKMIEAVCIALFALIVAFLCVFMLDRIWDTPSTVRLGVFVATLAICMIVPWSIHRWIWRHRRLDQVARLLAKKSLLGDHLLGIIELVHSESEQARSLALCEAAVEQVAEDAQDRNFNEAAPDSHHHRWGWLAGAGIVAVLALILLAPGATGNAWARLLAPWEDIPRYTFAAVQNQPRELVVPHGEPFSVKMVLNDDSVWRPTAGEIRLGSQRPVHADLTDGVYEFEMPPQIDDGRMQIRIGDFAQTVTVRPTLRPELTALMADVQLPDYLQRPEPLKKDVRGGSITLVKGSRAKFSATASRELASADVDGTETAPDGTTITGPEIEISESLEMQFQWQDQLGLASKEPFTLRITGRDDEAPTLTCENLPRKKVVLVSEQLSFRVKAHDDFGVKLVGIEWKGLDETLVKNVANGERILAAGGSEQESMDVAGTFSAKSSGIEPQPIEVRVFVEDYLPGRERVYSPPYILYVLTAEQHAIWVTEQLSKWHRAALEVRDRELRLFENNKELRDLPVAELDKEETRERIQRQSAAERANGRRLTGLTDVGTELIREASRNPEFGVGHLERWAEMLQILEDISDNRMPNVADLLKNASEAKTQLAQAKSQNQAPTVGENRSPSGGQPSESDEDDESKQKPSIPGIVDGESSQQPDDPDAKPQEPGQSPPSNPSFGLPVTTLKGKPGEGEACPAGEKMEEAVQKQEELLAEFERIADELNKILGNLEGSTLVKRLKAASREQYQVAGKISDQLGGTFGLAAARIPQKERQALKDLSGVEVKSSEKVSLIMDDMQAYFQRRRLMPFKTVLEDMREQDVIGGLRDLSDDIPKEHGLSIAQAEYWSDSLDRWAEDLVDPASGGT